jgi:hypothetical protein
MTPEDKRNLDIVGESFAGWYKSEIDAFVARMRLPEGQTDEQIATEVVRKVSQFTLGRLVSELNAVGVSTKQVIKLLQKHMQKHGET